jgi:hypothetical protein
VRILIQAPPFFVGAAQFIVFKKGCSASCHYVFGVYFSYTKQETVTYMLGMTQTSPIKDVIGFGKCNVA